ncbi:hypothetical protein QJS66_17450 [Kocuria rhizophila]|nr:hypothetical protein QJS66_17450 [Kocuria rhizophila]
MVEAAAARTATRQSAPPGGRRPDRGVARQASSRLRASADAIDPPRILRRPRPGAPGPRRGHRPHRRGARHGPGRGVKVSFWRQAEKLAHEHATNNEDSTVGHRRRARAGPWGLPAGADLTGRPGCCDHRGRALSVPPRGSAPDFSAH